MRLFKNPPTSFNTKALALPFSYAFIGQTQGTFPPGYNHDRNEVLLGEGNELFAAAKIEIQNWRHYPKWTMIIKHGGQTVQADSRDTVGVYFNLFGFWWENHCRIVYVMEKEQEWGFAYGTLSDHVEKGEEYFYLRKAANGKIYYGIHAFSRPGFWLAWLGYPLARFYQRKFVKQSLAIMKKFAQAYEK